MDKFEFSIKLLQNIALNFQSNVRLNEYQCQISTEAALAEGAPDGIDCFFENVGGSASTEVIKKMNKNGRIAICGAISVYNDEKPTMVPSFIQFMIYNVG